jgi:transposase
MTNWKLLDREQRGMVLAAMVKITQRGNKWVVPSQSGDGTRYTVDPDEQMPCCTCPDFEMTGCTCKHIFAVRIVRQRELFDDGTEQVTESVTFTQTTVKRPTYPQQWTEYNRTQTTEKEIFQQLLATLCEGVQEPEKQVMGRPRIPMSDAVFACCFKVFSTMSGRRFMTDLQDAKRKGHIDFAPHFNSIFKRLEDEKMTPILRDLIVRSSQPLAALEHDFAVDSTGFTTCRFDRWFDHKYGKVREAHGWVKAHFAVGVVTHVVTAVEIFDKNTNDSPVLPMLLETTAKSFTLSEVSADKAYSSVANHEAIEKHGAKPFIAFKSWATGAAGGVFQKAFHYFSLHREEFLQHYHKRSNVETVVMMIKSKFGDSVRSKTDTAMRNEVLCKVLCHNICVLISAMNEFGIRPDFMANTVCTKSPVAAQNLA